MDLSKLPKLSDTKSQISNPPQAAVEPAPVIDLAAPTPISLADTWLSIGAGLFLLLFNPRFLQWTCSRIFHTHFNEFMLDQNIVPYQTLPEFWSDLGPTLLGIVLILDGLLVLIRRSILVLMAFALTLISTAFNLIWVIVSYPKYGLAPISFLATIFGGFILSTQWVTYRSIKAIGK